MNTTDLKIPQVGRKCAYIFICLSIPDPPIGVSALGGRKGTSKLGKLVVIRHKSADLFPPPGSYRRIDADKNGRKQ
jgi:hypothetical protein